MVREKIESILVATDLGEGSEVIVALAASLAARTGAKLHTLHSMQLPSVPSADVVRRTGFKGQVEMAERRLQEQGRQALAGPGMPASEVVIIYVAHRAILDRAAEVSADLIVLGPHREWALRPRFLGTTADRVVRSAQVPCLIAGNVVQFPVGRAGVATDFSASAREALDQALAWSADLAGSPAEQPDQRGKVRVVHVAQPMIFAADPDLTEAIDREMSQQIGDALAAREPASAAKIIPEILWHDQPSEALVDWVDREQIGLLILGTHGRGFLKRALLGSTASSMTRLLPCPVLLVPPPSSVADKG